MHANLVIDDPAREFLHSRLVAGDIVSERFYHEGHRRDWILPRTQIHAEMVEYETGMRVTLNSGEYTHFVSLSVQDPRARFSDNYFDLLPGEEKKVSITTGKGEKLVLRAANSEKQVLSLR
jgi:beta-mannosidase